MSFRMSNAYSWMGVADQSKNTFMELKRKRVHRYVIFKIDEKKKQVVVDKTGGPGESYDDFTAALPEDDCRYAIYDFDFVTDDNCQKSKIFFIAWEAEERRQLMLSQMLSAQARDASPSISRIRSKMLYATSKDRFQYELDGIHYVIQATDSTEMELDVIKERAN